MKITSLLALAFLALCSMNAGASSPKKKAAAPPPPSAVELYEHQAAEQAQQQTPTAGAVWTPLSQFADLGRDLKASRVNDLVTIVVSEQASAVSTGATESSRTSSLAASVTGLVGLKSPAGALANLANTSNATALKGNGTTSRQTTLNTTMSARVTNVLPNGYLVLEGTKSVQVNSESQIITVRGIVRPADLTADNSVQSNRLAQMEIRLNGKGVVGDAIRRPNFLYRLILGLLPF